MHAHDAHHVCAQWALSALTTKSHCSDSSAMRFGPLYCRNFDALPRITVCLLDSKEANKFMMARTNNGLHKFNRNVLVAFIENQQLH